MTDLDAFISDVESIVALERDQTHIVGKIESLMRELILGNLSWLRAEYRRPPQHKTGIAAGYGQYCLYRRGTALSVILFCWGPGKGTPIHDHQSWGVLGFIDGCEEETRYRRVNDGSDPARARLEDIGAFSTRQGEVSHITTPYRDIHKVMNPGRLPSVSLHVYGCDMGTQRRRRYERASGRVDWYTTPHDSDEVVK